MVRPLTEKNICLRCKGARLLCGKKTCPILLKKSVMKSLVPFELDKTLRDVEFDFAKEFIGITSKGTINIREEEKFSIEEKFLLYLTGKIYAKEAGFKRTKGK